MAWVSPRTSTQVTSAPAAVAPSAKARDARAEVTRSRLPWAIRTRRPASCPAGSPSGSHGANVSTARTDWSPPIRGPAAHGVPEQYDWHVAVPPARLVQRPADIGQRAGLLAVPPPVPVAHLPHGQPGIASGLMNPGGKRAQ